MWKTKTSMTEFSGSGKFKNQKELETEYKEQAKQLRVKLKMLFSCVRGGRAAPRLEHTSPSNISPFDTVCEFCGSVRFVSLTHNAKTSFHLPGLSK